MRVLDRPKNTVKTMRLTRWTRLATTYDPNMMDKLYWSTILVCYGSYFLFPKLPFSSTSSLISSMQPLLKSEQTSNVRTPVYSAFPPKKYLVQKCKLDVINILHFRKAYKIDIEKETKIGTKKKLVNVKLILSSHILACINSLLFVYRHHLVTNKVKTVIVSPTLSTIQRQNCS